MSIRGVPTVAVLGGGCSGTLVAAQLVRNPAIGPCEVVLVDPAEAPGRGVAYGTSCPSHLLNVPAEQMSAYHDRRGDFVAWAHRRDPRLSALSFAPRMLYGDYLHDVWCDAQANASAGSSLVHIRSRAVSVQPGTERSRARVQFENGAVVDADHIVLAMGNLPPANAGAVPHGIEDASRYVADPWRPGALDGVSGSVLLIGTGLTAVDVALALDDRGVTGPVHAVSRHGLLPRAHRPDALSARPMVAAPEERTVRGLIAWLRRNAEESGDWRFAIDELRPHVPAVWRSLPDDERRRFLRHAARFWEVHRHRMAPEVASRIDGLIATHRMRVAAGTVDSYRESDGKVHVVLRRRGGAARGIDVAVVDHVINCTGPQLKVNASGDSFVDSLITAGLVTPGPYGLGLDVAEDGAVIDSRGIRSRNMWVIGPLRRGVEWETTAAREIRAQAVALAPRLSAPPGAADGATTPVAAAHGAARRAMQTVADAVVTADRVPASVLP